MQVAHCPQSREIVRVALELLGHKEYLSLTLRGGESSVAGLSNGIKWPFRSLPYWRR